MRGRAWCGGEYGWQPRERREPPGCHEPVRLLRGGRIFVSFFGGRVLRAGALGAVGARVGGERDRRHAPLHPEERRERRPASTWQPTNILLVGGSNCRGAQTKVEGHPPQVPEQIKAWLNRAFPVASSGGIRGILGGGDERKQHRVHNRGLGGSGACVFSAGLDDFLGASHPDIIDLVLTEFAINDGLE